MPSLRNSPCITRSGWTVGLTADVLEVFLFVHQAPRTTLSLQYGVSTIQPVSPTTDGFHKNLKEKHTGYVCWIIHPHLVCFFSFACLHISACHPLLYPISFRHVGTSTHTTVYSTKQPHRPATTFPGAVPSACVTSPHPHCWSDEQAMLTEAYSSAATLKYECIQSKKGKTACFNQLIWVAYACFFA